MLSTSFKYSGFKGKSKLFSECGRNVMKMGTGLMTVCIKLLFTLILLIVLAK